MKPGVVCKSGKGKFALFIYTQKELVLGFVGISQADRAGVEKAPRWAKICSKTFQTKTCFDFVILSLCVIGEEGAKTKDLIMP